MKIKLMLPFLMLFFLATIVSAADSLYIANDSISLTGNVSQTLSSSFLLVNNGTTNLTVSFSSYLLNHTTDNTKTLTVSSISSFQINNGTNQTVSISVPLSSTQYAGTYSGKLNVSGGNSSDTMDINVTVNSASAFTTTSPSFTVAQGKSGSGTFTITNTGNTDLSTVDLSMVGDLTSGSDTLSVAYLSVTPDPTSINYSNSTTITVSASPPSSQATGTYTGKIKITSGLLEQNATLSVTVRAPTTSLSIPSSIEFSESNRNTTVSTSFTMTNDGDYDLTNIVLSNNTDSKYNVSYSETGPFSLSPTQSKSITITAFVPEKEKSGKHSIGTLYINSDQLNQTSTIYIYPKTKLDVSKVDVYVDDSKDSDVSDGATVDKDAKPNSDIEVKVKVENLYTDSEDIKIRNIDVKGTLKDIDDGSDLEDTSSDFNLNAEDTETVILKFKVPEKVDEDTYTLDLEVNGEDENGVDHEASYVVKIKVNKENDDVEIKNAELGLSTLQCTRTTRLYVDIINIGSNDQDEVKLVVKNDKLGVDFTKVNIALDSDPYADDNEYSKSYSIDVADNFTAGTYPIDVYVYNDDGDLSDSESVNLIVKDCGENKEEKKEEKSTVVVSSSSSGTTGSTLTGTPTVFAQPKETAETEEVPFTQTKAYIMILGVVSVAALAGIIYLLWLLLFAA